MLAQHFGRRFHQLAQRLPASRLLRLQAVYFRVLSRRSFNGGFPGPSLFTCGLPFAFLLEVLLLVALAIFFPDTRNLRLERRSQSVVTWHISKRKFTFT